MTTKDRKALAAKHPDAWVPIEPGDTIKGRVSDVQDAWSDQRGENGSSYPLLFVTLEDGSEKKVHCFATVLYNEVMRRRPAPGDTIEISYLGVDPDRPVPEGHSPMERYRVRVGGTSARETANRVYDNLPPASGGRRGRQTAEQDEQEEIPF